MRQPTTRARRRRNLSASRRMRMRIPKCSARRCSSPRICTPKLIILRRPWRCWRSSSLPIPRRLPMRWKRAAPRRLCCSRGRQRAPGVLGARDRAGGCPGGSCPHRPHPLSCRQGADPTGRAGARCFSRVRHTAPLKKSLIVKRNALETALAATSAPPTTRLPKSRPPRPTKWPSSTARSRRTSWRPSGRRTSKGGTRAIQLPPRGTGVPIRGAGHQGARDQRGARQRRASSISGYGRASGAGRA